MDKNSRIVLLRRSVLPARFALLLVGVGLFSSTGSSRADLLVYEGFDYAPGRLVGDVGGQGWLGGWRGYPGANGSVVADSLTPAQPVATAGGHMETPDADTPMMRGFEHPLFSQAGVTWFSVLIRNDSMQTDKTYSFLMLESSLDKKQTKIEIGKEYNAETWFVAFGGQRKPLSRPADSTVTMVVLRIEHADAAGTDSIQAFIDPVIGAEPKNPEVTLQGLTIKPLDTITIRSGNNKKIFSYDEIRIGTTFADVVPPK